ncbi:unnamed protein product [Nyctereutes procyonoides]|uniref:(raccoon dog) hypothetical protein n=1 Tax=Nyctereutes procyonoides TaxID=34880 RepID=A0A811YFN7_NYCPR|nr:unnamed protein product [Nyctereutes procyonoides]
MGPRAGPEKRPHLLGPPEGLSMKGLGQGHGPFPSGPGVAPGPGLEHGGGGRLPSTSTGTAPLADPPQARPRGALQDPARPWVDPAPGGGSSEAGKLTPSPASPPAGGQPGLRRGRCSLGEQQVQHLVCGGESTIFI